MSGRLTLRRATLRGFIIGAAVAYTTSSAFYHLMASFNSLRNERTVGFVQLGIAGLLAALFVVDLWLEDGRK